MGRVSFDISMSLDGYVTAANMRPEEPLGEGGERLHEWAFSEDSRNREIITEAVKGLGAVIAGRRTYDDSLPYWGADGPTGPTRRPVFVVTHSVPEAVPEGGVYTFVTEGIERALQEAQVAAGEKDVSVMGGADIGRQFISAGLVDEISIHLVPVLFGSGMRLFEQLGNAPIELRTAAVITTPEAIHLRFDVARRGTEAN
jgi:dihydrofolate reductase